MEGDEDSLVRWLQWHIMVVIFLSSIFFYAWVISQSLYSLFSWYQSAQITHVLDDRLKELAEDADREKALKDIANAMAKEKGKAAEAAEKKAQAAEKAQQLAEGKLAKAEDWLGGIELKLVEAASLNLAQANQIADLNAAFEACESKWYDEGFADAEKSAEPVVHQAWFHGFEEGWLAAFQVMGVPEDSPLRNLAQILYLAPPPLTQSQVDAADEEETTSMRELVQAIDAHRDTADAKVTNNLDVVDYTQGQQPAIKGVPSQQADDAQLSPTDPAV